MQERNSAHAPTRQLVADDRLDAGQQVSLSARLYRYRAGIWLALALTLAAVLAALLARSPG